MRIILRREREREREEERIGEIVKKATLLLHLSISRVLQAKNAAE